MELAHDFVENLSKAALLMCRHRHGDVLEVQDAQLIAGLLIIWLHLSRNLIPCHRIREKL